MADVAAEVAGNEAQLADRCANWPTARCAVFIVAAMSQRDDDVPLYGRRQTERDCAPLASESVLSNPATLPVVWTDLSSGTPVSVTELDAIEAYLGALIDDLLR